MTAPARELSAPVGPAIPHLYAFRAVRRDGSTETGTIDATSAAEVTATLSARGLFPVEVLARGTSAGARARVSSAELALGLRIMADLLDAGLPMQRALQAFEELAPPAWRAALPSLRQSVKEGRSLTSALAIAPIAISPLTLGILHAGETGTGLVPAVRRAAEVAESIAANRAAIRSALAYPVVVAFAGFGAIGVLLTVVLPRFASVLADLGQELPASTRFVLALVTWSRTAFAPLLLGTIVVTVAMRAWLGTAEGRRHWHELLLSLPLIGSVRLASATGRLAASLSALLGSGVPIAVALDHSARATGDAAVERRVLTARLALVHGEALSTALEKSRAITTVAVRLVRAGEQSGRLAGMLDHAARLEADRADRAVKASVRMLEPILLLGFATLVAGVAASLLQAIYSVRPGG